MKSNFSQRGKDGILVDFTAQLFPILENDAHVGYPRLSMQDNKVLGRQHLPETLSALTHALQVASEGILHNVGHEFDPAEFGGDQKAACQIIKDAFARALKVAASSMGRQNINRSR